MTFFGALRPFSLVVSLATCGLGVTLASLDGYTDPILAGLVIVAGFLLQSGANLINDYADLGAVSYADGQEAAVRRNARLGAMAIAIACVIGLWLVSLRGWPLFMLGVLGVFGAWSYADGPINFKARGLGMPAVFLLTGMLMVVGSYYVMSGTLSTRVFVLALPFSLYACLLLLANELRDYEQDLADGHRTFTVRYGYEPAARLYRGLALVLAVITLGLALMRGPVWLLMPLLALLLLLIPGKRLHQATAQRRNLARLTGRCYLAYSLLFLSAFWLPVP